MPLTLVTSTKLRASSGSTCAGSIGTVTAGNLLTAGMGQYQGSTGDLVASGGGTWAHLTSAHNGTNSSRIGYSLSATGGATTVTFTVSSGASAPDGDVSEWTGATTWAQGVSNRNTGSGTPATSGSVTTLVADSVAYIHACFDGSQVPSITSPWVFTTEEQDGNTYMSYNAGYQLPTATAAFNGNWTFSGAIAWSASIASFHDTGGAAPARTPYTRQPLWQPLLAEC